MNPSGPSARPSPPARSTSPPSYASCGSCSAPTRCRTSPSSTAAPRNPDCCPGWTAYRVCSLAASRTTPPTSEKCWTKRCQSRERPAPRPVFPRQPLSEERLAAGPLGEHELAVLNGHKQAPRPAMELHFSAEIAAGDLNPHRCALRRQFNGYFLGHAQKLPGGDIAVVPGLLAVDRDGDLIFVEAVLKNDEQF